MSSILDKPAIRRAALPISVDQYHRLGVAGIIAEKTELLRGVILEKIIKSPQHSWLVQTLAAILRESVAAGYHVRQEQPLPFADSEPEPDIAVVVGTPDDYRSSHPATAEFVAEVAVNSVELDPEKAELYAANGVAEYWVVIANDRCVEVYTEPSSAGYAKQERHSCDGTVTLQCPAAISIDLSQLFR